MAPLCAALDPTLSGGEHVSNYQPFWEGVPLQLLQRWGLRDIAALPVGVGLLFLQGLSFGCHVTATSPESYDEALAADLMQWTQRVLEPYLLHYENTSTKNVMI